MNGNKDYKICGVGYTGKGKYKSKTKEDKITREYVIWRHMIHRCYEEDRKDRNLSYVDCEVCIEWHSFQKFAPWYHENYYSLTDGKVCLDKDILNIGNKLYSPDNCVFIPERINIFFSHFSTKHKKSEFPLGVQKIKTGRNSFRYEAKISKNGKGWRIGRYHKLEEACNAYKVEKEIYAKELAEEYKQVIDKRVYEILRNFKLEEWID